MNDFKKKSKRVKRLESGVYTIEPESVRSRNDHLCQICGIKSNCPVLLSLNLPQIHTEVMVRNCARFVPTLSFKSPYIGLGFDLFNTLRVGTAWVNRLESGNIIALIDADNGAVIRYGKVHKVVYGNIEKMLKIHAKFNHLAMGGKNIAEVEKFIRKAYGNFLIKEAILTAIYIEKVTHDELDVLDKKLGDPPVSIHSDNIVNLDWHRNKS